MTKLRSVFQPHFSTIVNEHLRPFW